MSANAYVIGDGGLCVTRRMRELLATPGILGKYQGAQELRELYQEESRLFQWQLLNDFAMDCYTGSIEDVIRMWSTGKAPPLSRAETPFEFGYATLVIAGHQRSKGPPRPGLGRHKETLKFLLEKGCPPDVEDICKYTALHHASMNPGTSPELVRILLEHGANVNHQNRFGVSPVVCAFMGGHAEAVDVLMKFGADLTLLEADGHVAGDHYVDYGPRVTAVVAKWLRKRAGEQPPPLDGKKCDFCGKMDSGDLKLKACSACHSARYCSSSCQKNHWKAHKLTCKPFTPANTVILKPNYTEIPLTHLVPTADWARNVLGVTGAPSTPAHHQRGARHPSSYPKSVIIKVQVPISEDSQSLLIYTKKRDFVCTVNRREGPSGYDRISQVIKEKGVGGKKGYFAGELKNAYELVVKIGEMLAEQPW